MTPFLLLTNYFFLILMLFYVGWLYFGWFGVPLVAVLIVIFVRFIIARLLEK